MSLEQDIENLIDQFIPTIQAAFIAAMQGVKDAVILGEMVNAIRNGDAVQALRVLGVDDLALRPVVTEIERAFEAGGITTGNTFPKRLNTPVGRAVFRFDPRTSRAERWLREESSKLVTNVQEETITNLQNVISNGVRDGRNPNSIALDIVGRIDPITKKRTGGLVGLTKQQAKAVSNARDELSGLDENYFTRGRRDKRFDRTVRKAIETGKKLDAATIDRIATSYSNSLLDLRGENIARTEAVASLNQSQFEATRQAIDKGAVKQSNVKKEWDAAGDSRTRPTHKMMDGQIVEFEEPFVSPGGSKLMHPGDRTLGADGEEVINCRCRMKLKIDWIKGVK